MSNIAFKFSETLYRSIIDPISTDCGARIENVFVSPISIFSVLSMTMLGSRGETESELKSTLSLPIEWNADKMHDHLATVLKHIFDAEKNKDLNIANGMFLQMAAGISEKYQSQLSTIYHAVLRKKDSEKSRLEINDWVSDATKGKISQLFPSGSIDNQTMLVLANAVYFKGSWTKPFNKESTRKGEFHCIGDNVIDIMMMNTKKEFQISRFDDGECRLIKLPFSNSDLSLVIALPNQKQGLQKLLSCLSQPGTLGKMLNANFYQQEVILQLPRFKLGSGDEPIAIVELLKKMGVTKLFSPNEANLSGISPSQLCVSNIQHLAVLENAWSEVAPDTIINAFHRDAIIEEAPGIIDPDKSLNPPEFVNIDAELETLEFNQFETDEVDEEGARAAAATGSQFMLTSMPNTPEFIVDHPFFVAIVQDDDNKKESVPLFLGHVVKPHSF